MALDRKTLMELARHGAAARIQQLETEIASIRKAFSGVVRRGRKAITSATEPAAPRKRRKMSAKARKAISDAQKARWAKQKAGKK